MDRPIRRLMASVFALVVAFTVSGWDVSGETEDSCFLCHDEVDSFCDGKELDPCPEDPEGMQCLHIACSQLCGINAEAIRCEDWEEECGYETRFECTDEVG